MYVTVANTLPTSAVLDKSKLNSVALDTITSVGFKVVLYDSAPKSTTMSVDWVRSIPVNTKTTLLSLLGITKFCAIL
jgi:hypothetical protein